MNVTRGNASHLCGWVTLATVAISRNSGRWHISIGPSGICFGFGTFGSLLSQTLGISLLLPLFLAGFSCRSVWSYDGELKWSGRKSYWCLSKYHTWVHLDQTPVSTLKTIYYLFYVMSLLMFSFNKYLLQFNILKIIFKMMTFILTMTSECGFIQLSWATYINNEMELLVSLLGSYRGQLYSSYYQQSWSNLIRQTKSF